MKYDIHQTAVVPYIVAERALWTVIEGDKRFAKLQPLEVAEMVNTHYPALVTKAERLFNVNANFRKQLLDKRKDIRFTLEVFMEHWSKALLDGKQIN